MTEFAPGDIVRLKSGGPKMTVLEPGAGGLVCKWFDRNGKLHNDNFNPALLDIFVPKPRNDDPAA